MENLEITPNDRLLIIAPHPDDECIGCGGIMSLYPELCDIYLLTDGSRADLKIDPKLMKDIRRQEFIGEMKSVKINNFWTLDYEDSTLINHPECCDDIDFSVYSKIFVPMLEDQHHDHIAAYCYVMESIRKNLIESIEVYQYEVQSLLEEPSHYIDISSVIDRKLELIRFHKSQIEIYDYAEWTEKRDSEMHASALQLGEGYYEFYKKTNISSKVGEAFARKHAIYTQRSASMNYLLTLWLKTKINKKSIAEIMKDADIKSVAIYGFSELGKLLYQELTENGIEVRYAMDRNKEGFPDSSIKIYDPYRDDQLPNVDCIVISVLNTYMEVKADLISKGYTNIFILQELLEKVTLYDEIE